MPDWLTAESAGVILTVAGLTFGAIWRGGWQANRIKEGIDRLENGHSAIIGELSTMKTTVTITAARAEHLEKKVDAHLTGSNDSENLLHQRITENAKTISQHAQELKEHRRRISHLEDGRPRKHGEDES